MKTIIFTLMSVAMLTQVSAQVSNADVQNYLKAKYNVIKFTDNVSQADNSVLIDVLKTNPFVTRNAPLTELDLVNVDEVYFQDGKVALVIPFKSNSKEVLTLVVRGTDYANILNSVIIRNQLDGKGTGRMTVITTTETFINQYTDGVLNQASGRHGCFRRCFDQAYDDICDGFIGCLMWSINPLVSATAAVYCQAMC